MWCAIYLLILVVTGYAISAAFAPKASRIEIAALSLIMGPGAVGFVLIILSLFGLRPMRGEIFAIAGVFAIAAFFAVKFRKPDRPINAGSPQSWWLIICCVAIGYGLISIGIDTLVYPVIEWDAFAIWQLKAQVLTLYPLHPQPSYFTNIALSYSHLRYPILLPMISAGMHAMTGHLDDLSKTISLVLYSGTLLAVFAAVKPINGSTAALTATALLACLEPFCRYGGSGTAEMAITAFYAGSVLCILRWREKREAGFLILAAIFSGWMALTKNEGLALAGINAVVVAFFSEPKLGRKTIALGALIAIIVALIYLPWLLFSWGLPRTDEDYAGRFASLQIFSNLGRLPQILGGFGKEFIRYDDWGIFWIIAAGLALAERRRFKSPLTAIVGVLLILHFLAYIPAFLVTNWVLEELLSVTTDRLFMHVAPAAAILIGLLWPTWVGGTSGHTAEILL